MSHHILFRHLNSMTGGCAQFFDYVIIRKLLASIANYRQLCCVNSNHIDTFSLTFENFKRSIHQSQTIKNSKAPTASFLTMLKLLLISLTLAVFTIASSTKQNGPKARRLLGKLATKIILAKPHTQEEQQATIIHEPKPKFKNHKERAEQIQYNWERIRTEATSHEPEGTVSVCKFLRG